MYFLKDVLLPVVLVVVVVILPIGVVCFFVEKKTCTNYEQVTGRNTSYKLFGGCFVETGSGWLTMDEYSHVIIAREGLSEK